jgi:ABC-type molybdenum transport system ATPase subunit/photorepair protein PhrA
MGASGSGKSSLLDLLSGRKTTGHSSGLVLFGSTIPSRSFLRRHTGYVEQFGAGGQASALSDISWCAEGLPLRLTPCLDALE